MIRKHELGFLCGRFQPPHYGHKLLIKTAVMHCETVLILIGSAQESGTLRNPFSIDTRIKILEAMCEDIKDCKIIIKGINDLKNEYNDSYSWGDYLIQNIKEITGIFPDCTVYGDDSAFGQTKRNNWYRDEYNKQMTHYILPRDTSLPSSTITRGIILMGDKKAWENVVDVSVIHMFDELRENLLKVPVYFEIYEQLKNSNNLNLTAFKQLYNEFEEKDKLEKLKNLGVM